MGALRVRLEVSVHYIVNLLSPLLVLGVALFLYPRHALLAAAAALCGWAFHVSTDGTEYRTGKPDKAYSQGDWLIRTMRGYLKLTLHNTVAVEDALLAGGGETPGGAQVAGGGREERTGQAIFAFFPHGINSDFRILMDGMMYDSFSRIYARGASARTLAANVLFRIPGVRSSALKTACVDAGRPTATRCLQKGHSLFLCPGGQDEQIETIFGRERVFLRRRAGFIRLALINGVPVVPAYCFGSSDLYRTSRALHGLRVWMVRHLRIALPLYAGDWGFFMYPTPKGFPLQVPQHVVFGAPLYFEQTAQPSAEQLAAAHERFIGALTELFDAHKARFGYAERKLEVL